MLESFLIVGHQVVILFILIAIGFICNKTRLLKPEAVRGMTDLVLYAVAPCLLIISFQREFNRQMLGVLGVAFLVGLAYHLLNVAFAHTVVHDPADRRKRVLRFSLVFSNAGYMAIPLQRALLGEDGVFYGAAVIAVFNLFLWSYGLVLMSGENRHVTAKNLILNPGVIGVFLGFIFFISSVTLPTLVVKPMQAMAELNTPLPMLIIGYYLADAHFGRVLKDARVYWVMFLRLLVVPLLLLGLMLLLGIRNQTMVVACIIAASAPTAAATTMFSAKFGQDTILSVGLVSYSTLISIISMPLVVGLARYLTR